MAFRHRTVLQLLSSARSLIDFQKVITAALFEFFFPDAKKAISKETDIRYADFFWSMVLGSLKVITKFNEDPSKRATLHLQVIYILKRLNRNESVCENENDDAVCENEIATTPPFAKTKT